MDMRSGFCPIQAAILDQAKKFLAKTLFDEEFCFRCVCGCPLARITYPSTAKQLKMCSISSRHCICWQDMVSKLTQT
eukprot:scaffold154547_cov13-Tisochrysis_lutea.AAC.1